jgi:eukaryotic-like serine/threonine-protein kinase
VTDQKPEELPPKTIPAGGADRSGDDLSRLQEELRGRWARGERVLVEDFISELPAIIKEPDDILDLIYHEVLVREGLGEKPGLDEYLGRFPQFIPQLRDQFEVHQALKFTEWPGASGTHEIGWEATFPAESWVATGAGPSIPGYEVIRELGRGGMGVVYLAWQTGLKRLVAVKMVLAGEYSRPRDRDRFRAEAAAVARLEHPNLVKIHETGELEGYPYFSMEYVDGGRLADTLKGTPLPPRRAAQLVETLARATEAAHERGVIHRDLTPANVLFTSAGEPKIVDFGLAKLTIGGTGRTVTGDILGSPSYMAPEQASGHSNEVGPAADVYALGAILYDMLTGRPPFKGESVLATLALVVNDEPVSPSRLQPKVPRDLETVCLKCLSKDPSRRYPTAAGLADDLRRYLAGEPVRARPIGAVSRAARWARRRPGIAALLAVSATCAIAAFTVVAWKEGEARQAQRRAEQSEAAEKKQRISAESARAREAEQRHLYQGLSAALLRDRGLRHCDDGDIGRGLLWLAQSLKLVADDDRNLQHAIRTNIAGWQGQVHPLTAVLEHSKRVLAAGWGPDVGTIITAGADKAAHLWDARTGHDSGRTLRLTRAVTAAAFSSDGTRILTAAGQEVRLWKAVDGEPALREGLDLGKGGQLLAHAFSRDGRRLMTSTRRGETTWLQSWLLETGKRIGTEIELGAGILRVTFSPDGEAFVTAGDDRDVVAQLWRTAERKPVRGLHEHSGRVTSVAFNPMGGRSFVTGSYDQTCRLWESASGEPLGLAVRHSGAVRAVAFSSNGKTILVGGQDRLAQLWSLKDNTPLGPAMRHPAAVKSVAFSPDGLFALTVSWDQVRLWDAGTGELLGAPLPHMREIVDASFSPGGESVLTRSRDTTVRIWSTAPLHPAGLRLRHKGWVTAVAFHPTAGEFLTGVGGSEGKALSWSSTPGRQPEVALDGLGPILSLAYRPDSKVFAAGTRDRRVWIGGAASASNREPLVLDDRVWAVAFSPDGRTILIGTEKGRAEFWDLATRQKRPGPLRHEKAVYAVAYSPDGRTVLTGSEDMTARLWDAATHLPLGDALAHQGTVYAVAFQPPDGQVVLTGSDDATARLWQTATGRPVGEPLQHPARVLSVAFSPDGRIMATGCGDGAARLWDAATGHPIGCPLLHHGPVRAVAFGPRPRESAATTAGWILITGSEDMTARVWDAPLPAVESPEQLMRSLQVANGMILDSHGVAESLAPGVWQQLRSPGSGRPARSIIPSAAASEAAAAAIR